MPKFTRLAFNVEGCVAVKVNAVLLYNLRLGAVLLSEFLTRYGAILLLFAMMLAYSAFAHFGLFMALGEYAAALTPQVDGRPFVMPRRKLIRASWTGVAAGVAIALTGYAALAERVGEVFLLRLPESERRIGFKIFVIVALMYVAFKSLRSLRASYLAYRQGTNFRIWLRGVSDNGLSAAHVTYLHGWVYRAIGSVLSTVSMCGLFILAVLVAAPGKSDAFSRSDGIRVGAVLAGVVTLSLLRKLLVQLWTVLRPESALADLCTRTTIAYRVPQKREKQKKSQPAKHERRFVLHRPGAWRDEQHEDSFKIASLIEWSVRRAQGRFAQYDYEQIVLTARQLAQSLRLNALQVADGPAADIAYQERRFLALQLTTSRNPLDFVERIGVMTAGDPEPPVLPRRRAARFVESLSGGINVHWPTLKTLGIVVAIIAFLFFGRFTDAVGLLK
ncbi:hypothetical protein SK803_04215 [Lentzea sp. BCCO 10_0856]|uniref:Uncharacterized protein n=1 Tax=Lentzea miocenica TaxID=3095431 RepID=A0ABU4SU35_9PSEU|nr:hypothetical protein [Lentzea sp. BCCO 10_0856]MDX8029399.1 hypothetical protein [Lentzea sp. BCCO 10_0856]